MQQSAPMRLYCCNGTHTTKRLHTSNPRTLIPITHFPRSRSPLKECEYAPPANAPTHTHTHTYRIGGECNTAAFVIVGAAAFTAYIYIDRCISYNEHTTHRRRACSIYSPHSIYARIYIICASECLMCDVCL